MDTLDRNALKVTALLERVKEITAFYEDRDADRRVEITVLTQELNQANNALGEQQASHEAELAEAKKPVKRTPKK